MSKVNIIAELCQNHLGQRDLLSKMVKEVASTGAQYCKIQSMKVTDLTFRNRFENGVINKKGEVITIKRPYKQEYERLSPLDLSDDDHKYFIDTCRNNNVLPLTTVFTRNRVEFLSKLDWGHKKIKIASFDCRSKPLLKDLVDAGFDHLIISTGSTFDEEIEETSSFLKDLGCNFTFLHCVSIYPTPLSAGHIKRIDYLRQFTNSVGFSEHSNYETDNLKLSAMALTKNIQWIERHFTSVDKTKTKDGRVSLSKDQLKELVKLTYLPQDRLMEYINKNIDKDQQGLILGSQKRELSKTELLNRDYYHGRFASITNDKITYNWEGNEKFRE